MLVTKTIKDIEITDAILSASSVLQALHTLRTLELAERLAESEWKDAQAKRREGEAAVARAVLVASAGVSKDRAYLKTLINTTEDVWANEHFVFEQEDVAEPAAVSETTGQLAAQ